MQERKNRERYSCNVEKRVIVLRCICILKFEKLTKL